MMLNMAKEHIGVHISAHILTIIAQHHISLRVIKKALLIDIIQVLFKNRLFDWNRILQSSLQHG
jgi:hypothetical protein